MYLFKKARNNYFRVMFNFLVYGWGGVLLTAILTVIIPKPEEGGLVRTISLYIMGMFSMVAIVGMFMGFLVILIPTLWTDKRPWNRFETAPVDYIQDLERYAMRFLPKNSEDVKIQYGMLDRVKTIFVIDDSMLPPAVKEVFDTASYNKTSFDKFIGMLVTSVDYWITTLDKEKTYEKIMNADTDNLMKTWIILAYYRTIIRPEYIQNINMYYHKIAHLIFQRGFVVPEVPLPKIVDFEETSIHINSNQLFAWKQQNSREPQVEFSAAMKLNKKEPVISLYEDGVKTREYCLQTENDEDFTGKYFHISVRLGFIGAPAVPVAQIDGFISDTSDERDMMLNDVGYRMEGHFLACGGEMSKQRYEMNRGQDLVMKALKYQGYTTPSNVRLIGVCPDCGKSFAFRGYAFYMSQNDVAYSDDGLDVCVISEYDIDKENWIYETEGKTFRYYNSFKCPHCGTPYIDYEKHPENKVFGVSGCVLLGRKYYK